VAELDINPLLADASGVVALDARVVVRPHEKARRSLAIRPYPRELEQEIEIGSGRRFLLRPIRPEDERAIVEMLNRSSPADIRLRFFAPIREIGHTFAARLTQIDYNREMALVALAPKSGEIVGVVHLMADPDKKAAEFAVMVRSDFKGAGLGYSLMTRILDYARASGIGRVFGDVLRENTTMLQMVGQLGFATVSHDDDHSDVVMVELDLSHREQ
jgi:acetyltransferase